MEPIKFLVLLAVLTLAILAIVLRARPGPRGRRGKTEGVFPKLFAFQTGGVFSFVVPSYVTGRGLAHLYGAGGGGGGAVQDTGLQQQYGGGGGGGAYIKSQMRAKPGSTLTITVGQGGAGGLAETGIMDGQTGAGAGIAGGFSSVSGLLGLFPTLTAGGGGGAAGLEGDSSQLPFNQTSLGGAGGVPDPLAYVPGQSFVALPGQVGSNANGGESVAGYGGSCPNGGGGGAGGIGFVVQQVMANPTPGAQPGGGGGGGASNNVTVVSGAPGADGLVVLEFY